MVFSMISYVGDGRNDALKMPFLTKFEHADHFRGPNFLW